MCKQTLSEKIRELVDAGFAGIWIDSLEPDEAVAELRKLAAAEGWTIAGTDANGYLTTEPGANFSATAAFLSLAGLPIETMTVGEFDLLKCLSAMSEAEQPVILPLPNCDVSDPVIRQTVFRAIQVGKRTKRYTIIIAPKVALPPALEKVFAVVDHELPTREQIEAIAREIAVEPGEMPEGPELEKLLDAAAGLTRYEAEGAFALSIARHNRLDAKTVFTLKATAIEKSGLAKIWKGDENIDDIGGLGEVKKRLRMAGNVTGKYRPKGMILVGQPGTGKSYIAKAAGKILGRPVVSASLSRLKGQYVGETGKNTRRLLALIEAIGPCVVVLDEGSQQLGGGAERHETTEEMIGELLPFLNDQQAAYILLTANEIKSIPDALTRPGRFDAVFFVDLPAADQQAEIWRIHLAKYGLPADTPIPACPDWTGAEIEEACKAAAMYGPQGLTLEEATGWVLPIATRQAEAIEQRRQWAQGRCFDADRPGPYTKARGPAAARRSVARKTDNQ